jgi:anti-sigma B factor antagonist
MTPELVLQTRAQDDTVVVECSGRLTAQVSDMLHREVKRLIPGTRHIVLDLTGVTHMDSLGLGTIAGLYFSAKTAGCDLKVINLSKRVRELFRLTNLLSVFDVCGEQTNRAP